MTLRLRREKPVLDGDNGKEDEENQRSRRHEDEPYKQRDGKVGYVQIVKFVLPYLWSERDLKIKMAFATCCIIVLLERIIKVITPHVFGLMLGQTLEQPATPPYWHMMTWFFCLWMDSASGLQAIFEPVSQYWILEVQSQIRNEATEHVMNLSMDFHQRENADDINGKLERGIDSALNLVVYGLFDIIPAVCDLFLAIWQMTRMFNVHIACCTIGPAIVYIYMTKTAIEELRPQFTKLVEKNRHEVKRANQLIRDYSLIRFLNRKDLEFAGYREIQRDYNSTRFIYKLEHVLLRARRTFLLQLGFAYSFSHTLVEVYSTAGPSNTLVYLYEYWVAVTSTLPEIMNSILACQEADVHLARLLRLLDTRPTVVDGVDPMSRSDSAPCKLELVDVGFQMLKNIHLTVDSGQRIAIVGPSGAGKTTLLNLLSRYYDPCEGKILVNNQNLRNIRPRDLRESIAYVPQNAKLPNRSVLDVLRHDGQEPGKKDIEQICRQLNVHERIESAPDGYNSVLGEQGSKLSGGETQRLVLAQVLLRKPGILLIDEGTSNVDSQSQAAIIQELTQIRPSTTVIMVAHRLSTCLDADSIVVMKDGTIIEQGKHEELLKKKGEYWRLWESENGKS